MQELDRNWRSFRNFQQRGIPPAVLSWILDGDSLTQRVRALCGQRTFRVQVLQLSYRYASTAEAALLHLRPGIRVLEREVQLCCGSTPLIYARSLIPVTVFTGRAQRLKFQGSKSLGATLFSDPSVTRGALQIAALPAAHIPGAQAVAQTLVWGRRSVFHLQGQPLLVAEFYLPQLFLNY
jgi:chorismate--pyruvate lyase